jgi:hypothetical protein
MNEHLHIALDKNYFIRVDALDEDDGCIAHFPRNLFQKTLETSYIYMIEDDGVAIYNNSFELINKLECDPFVRRAIICFDILIKGFKLKVPTGLTLVYRNDKLVGDYRYIKSIMKFDGDVELEKSFVTALTHIKDDAFIVDKELSDIFNHIKTKILTTGDILC